MTTIICTIALTDGWIVPHAIFQLYCRAFNIFKCTST